MIALDQLHTTRHHLPVPFNSGTGFDSPSNLADSRQHAAFFASVTYAIGASMISMVGRSGEGSRPAGSKFRSVNPAMRLPPPFDSGRQAIQTNLEATMPSFALRAFRALLSRSPAVSIIRPAADLAEARRMAADLVMQGARVRIQPAARGFDVEVLS